MLTPSPDILPWLAVFAPALTAPTFQNVLGLFCGMVLAPGRRTVTAALRVLGLAQGNFSKYHHFFNRARWSPLHLSRLLLGLLIRTFLPPGSAVVVLVDEILERRKSRKLPYRGIFRDPTASTAEQVQFAWGIRWLCFALLVPVPWSTRPWALPFLLYPLRSEKACQREKRKHHSLIAHTAFLLRKVRRWVPEREFEVVGDGSYAAVPLAAACRRLAPRVTLVSRLRLDAVLHAFPTPKPQGKRGPQAKKGERLPSLEKQLADPATVWYEVTLRWYGQGERQVEYATGIALWYRPGYAPVPLRWVLVRSPQGEEHPVAPGACFSTAVDALPEAILGRFMSRWNIEVTFAEIRTHLGLETQRHWSRQATGRVVPCLFGVFSLVVVAAKAEYPEALPLAQSAWYPKAEASFADTLAAVRATLWRLLTPALLPNPKLTAAASSADCYLIPRALWERIQQVACYTS